MKASIILCTYQSERYEDFVEALDSLNAQSYENENMEIVVVVDGNRELYDRILKSGIEEADRGKGKVKVILNEKNLGLSASRNIGVKEATGGIIAFFDDDAVADKNWVEELVRMYEEHDAIAAGGEILPEWVTITDEGDGVFDNRGRMIYYSRYPKM
jgi:glycosyltransferase involved in cell wall biosynthesis